jgi:hypothetical protein
MLELEPDSASSDHIVPAFNAETSPCLMAGSRGIDNAIRSSAATSTTSWAPGLLALTLVGELRVTAEPGRARLTPQRTSGRDWKRPGSALIDRPAVGEVGLVLDPWQAEVLRSPSKRTLMLCSRQSGKSTTAAIMSIGQAVTAPGSLTLLVSPSLRQSTELFRTVIPQA